MFYQPSNSLLFQLITRSDFRLRLVRHSLLWLTAILLIYRGFHFVASSMPKPSPEAARQYAMLSAVIFGSLTMGGYWLITTLTRRFILLKFRVDLFILGIVGVHIATAEIVLAHFWIFIHTLTLSHLPRFYSTYADHITHLSIWKAPFDSVIVWLFSFSLFYNYLLYAVSLKVFKDLFTINIHQVNLQKENLRLEFEFLKAQMNPHFLFNTLNNIYSFSVHSPEKVSGTLLKLADLLRYTLYETNGERVSLAKELAFLTSYIDLQRIRHDNHVTIRFTVLGQSTGQLIPPLLLIIFVENAFKHGIQASAKASWVDIEVNISQESLLFRVINSRPSIQDVASPGIGLSNVKKRLHYLYPSQHHLTIHPQPTQFLVQLTLDLNGANL